MQHIGHITSFSINVINTCVFNVNFIKIIIKNILYTMKNGLIVTRLFIHILGHTIVL